MFSGQACLEYDSCILHEGGLAPLLKFYARHSLRGPVNPVVVIVIRRRGATCKVYEFDELILAAISFTGSKEMMIMAALCNRDPKIAICASSHNFVGLYLRN